MAGRRIYPIEQRVRVVSCHVVEDKLEIFGDRGPYTLLILGEPTPCCLREKQRFWSDGRMGVRRKRDWLEISSTPRYITRGWMYAYGLLVGYTAYQICHMCSAPMCSAPGPPPNQTCFHVIKVCIDFRIHDLLVMRSAMTK